MVFFLIVPSVMVISIILIHVIFKRLGIEISYITLAICAVMSIAVDFVAAIVSPVPGQEYFVRLLALILASAAIVTALNKFLIDKNKPIEQPIIETASENINTLTAITETAEDNETLEEILDLAYFEKSNGNINKAIDAYKRAFDKFANDENAPFIVVDLGNIYKEQALYLDAIRIYDKALELTVIKNNPATQRGFKNNRVYLQTVYLVLAKHNALSTPFSKIPAAYLREIESEFQAARSQGE